MSSPTMELLKQGQKGKAAQADPAADKNIDQGALAQLDSPQAEAETAQTESPSAASDPDPEAAIAEQKAETKPKGKTAKKLPAPKAKGKQVAEKAVEGEVLAPGVDLIKDTAHQLENLKSEAEALDLGRKLVLEGDMSDFKLGGVLSVIRTNGWWQNKGYANWAEYMAMELGVGYRKGQYVMGNYQGLVESGVKWDQVSHLGWTKLKELIPVLSPDTVHAWVKKAEQLTVVQLHAEVEKAKQLSKQGQGKLPPAEGAGDKTVTTKTFKLHSDQKEVIQAALDKAKSDLGTPHDTVALEHICIAWGSGAVNKGPKPSIAPQGTTGQPTLEEMFKQIAEASTSLEEALTKVFTAFEAVWPNVDVSVNMPDQNKQAAAG